MSEIADNKLNGKSQVSNPVVSFKKIRMKPLIKMQIKRRGWKEGIISEDLVGFGYTHKKGDLVRYKRVKTAEDKDGFRLTEYEWHYLDENNYHLIRTIKRIIEGEEKIIEPELRTRNK